MILSTETALKSKNQDQNLNINPEDSCFTFYTSDVGEITPPDKFTYPFDYKPHLLCIIAARELQEKIDALPHIFDTEDNSTESLGKMFGVLVVKNSAGQMGYLSAFSGKLFGGNHFKGFVPPVFDTLDPEGFYKKGEEEITQVNIQISKMENDAEYIAAQEKLQIANQTFTAELYQLKNELKVKKAERDKIRKSIDHSNFAANEILSKLNNESAGDHYLFKDFKRSWKIKIDKLSSTIDELTRPIMLLKEKRKVMSAQLQYRLHKEYNFLNADGNEKNLLEIFESTDDSVPPSGAGECAAPKLLQYAYKNEYKPVAMAEFWWGASPSSELRKHGHYYPACKSKCKPILGHMLQGLTVDDCPMDATLAKSKEIEIIYEDDDILIVHKPEGLLSVPGKEISDSVETRVRSVYPNIECPVIVHRLDMSTSGIMVLTKNLKSYHQLQSQFTHKKIIKRYEAILEGTISCQKGIISLPLRVDLDNRPRQMVCYTHGKPSLTHYEVIKISDNYTYVHFYPVTGRTHQLRVHSAHTSGLNTPVLGDDLYGNRGIRLFLHAAYIKFRHPTTEKEIEFYRPSGFDVLV
jgi:tRNA pseudouridine32 synthase/23S rRNA pseudouridine746 synthase